MTGFVNVRGVLLALTLALAAPVYAGEYEDALAIANRGDPEAALPLLRELAAKGNARAANTIGILYANGRGVPKDDAEAARWYRQAAEGGFHWGQYNLGVMYRDGRGVPKDAAEAAQWFRKAAERGNAEGQNSLGVMYQIGSGVTKDYAEAVLWYRKAADQGLPVAQDNLGMMLRDRHGVERDDAEAVRLFRVAADKGYARAAENLGVMYRTGRGVAQDDAEAVRWFRKAVESGRPSAQAELAYMYETGRGVAKDELQALRWYWNAAAQGNAHAQARLGAMFRDGRGTERNPDAALEWFGKAAAQGNASAKAAVDALRDDRNRATNAAAMAASVKAAEAAQPALSVADPERAALAHEIVVLTGLREQLARMQERFRSLQGPDAPGMVDDKLREAVRASLVASFGPDAVATIAEAKLAESHDIETLRAGLQWERSDLGSRMRRLDVDADRPERDAELQALARKLVTASAMPADDPRVRACAEADALAEHTDSILPFLGAVSAAAGMAAVALDRRAADVDQLRRIMALIHPMLREAVRVSVLAQCVIAYRDLGDGEIARWLDFLRSDVGGRYARGANAALRQAMVARSEIFAQTLLDAVRRIKQQSQSS